MSEAPAQGAAKKDGKRKAPKFFQSATARRLAAIRQKLLDLVEALRSADHPTRKGARLFFASLLGLALVTILAGHRYWNHVKELRARAARVARQQNAVLAEFLRKRDEIAKRKSSTLLLGGFSIALEPDQAARGPSSYHQAEVELVIECDSKESRDYLEEHLAQAKNEVTNTFVRIDRQDLMSADGKARLKRDLQERLNLLLPKGRVESVFFSKLVLT